MASRWSTPVMFACCYNSPNRYFYLPHPTAGVRTYHYLNPMTLWFQLLPHTFRVEFPVHPRHRHGWRIAALSTDVGMSRRRLCSWQQLGLCPCVEVLMRPGVTGFGSENWGCHGIYGDLMDFLTGLSWWFSVFFNGISESVEFCGDFLGFHKQKLWFNQLFDGNDRGICIATPKKDGHVVPGS